MEPILKRLFRTDNGGFSTSKMIQIKLEIFSDQNTWTTTDIIFTRKCDKRSQNMHLCPLLILLEHEMEMVMLYVYHAIPKITKNVSGLQGGVITMVICKNRYTKINFLI